MRVLIATFGFVSILIAGSAYAQAVKNGGPNGIIISGQAFLTTPGLAVTAMTTPATDHFIVTDFCVGTTGSSNPIIIRGTTVGNFASGVDGSSGCQHFSAGIALPASETIECRLPGDATGTSFCTVSGVRTKK